jgi:hypothetical protein
VRGAGEMQTETRGDGASGVEFDTSGKKIASGFVGKWFYKTTFVNHDQRNSPSFFCPLRPSPHRRPRPLGEFRELRGQVGRVHSPPEAHECPRVRPMPSV